MRRALISSELQYQYKRCEGLNAQQTKWMMSGQKHEQQLTANQREEIRKESIREVRGHAMMPNNF